MRGDAQICTESSSPVVDMIGKPMDSIGIHVIPIKKMMNKNKKHTIQLRCTICHQKTTNQWSACTKPITAICSSKTGRDCLKKH